ncbi:MAG: hypothetical protein K8R92_05290 [Planctomycetes bacterium]|nr:hypothetical protein [Planctomycetota bacterium]
MFAAASILVLALAMDDATKPGDLVPIEQGLADRSVTGTSLRIQPVELSTTTNFNKLYGVAGRPDLFVRSQGGVYAVFDQGAYRTVYGKTLSKTFAQWPAGTTFHIGQPDFTKLKASGIREGQIGANTPPGTQLTPKSVGGPDARIGEAPVEGLVKVKPLSERSGVEPANRDSPAKVSSKDAGFGHHSVDMPAPKAAPAKPADNAAAAPTTAGTKSESMPAVPSPSSKDGPAQPPAKP